MVKSSMVEKMLGRLKWKKDVCKIITFQNNAIFITKYW